MSKPLKFVLMTLDLGTKGELILRLLQTGLRPELVVTYRPDYLPVRSGLLSRGLSALGGFIKSNAIRLLGISGYETYWICKKAGVPVWPANTANSKAFALHLENLDVDYAIVSVFKVLKPWVFNAPKLGTINCHPALLPYHKGASPINWVVYTGDHFTGITYHWVVEKIDEGEIIEQHYLPLSGKESALTLWSYISHMTVDFTVDLLYRLLYQTPVSSPQLRDVPATYDTKASQAMGELHLDWSYEKIERVIRSACDMAFLKFEGENHRILYAVKLHGQAFGEKDAPFWVDGNICILTPEKEVVLLIVDQLADKHSKGWIYRNYIGLYKKAKRLLVLAAFLKLS
jgi:methionyl-tRNA formyltransferase